jgi:hypothetical protein
MATGGPTLAGATGSGRVAGAGWGTGGGGGATGARCRRRGTSPASVAEMNGMVKQ